MIQRAIDKRTKREILRSLDPLIADWFDGRFSDLTEPQALAIPAIEARENVLISSPTGSGKTLTAFLSILDRLYKLQKRGELEDRIYAVYISPLKALANDINKNLLAPLSELSELARSRGEPEPKIRVAVRTGDTSPRERQRQATKPPHIFITTPESLALVISTPKFSAKFNQVEYAIVDEIHEICDSKRGVALSLNLERLQAKVPQAIARIGLSATQAPIEEIGRFLVGHDGSDWRDLTIAEIGEQKALDLSVLCPSDDITALPFEIVNSKMYDLLSQLISPHRTTLIFTNTRSGTEQVVFKLKERGVSAIEAHHGSISKEGRISVENDLKDGKLKAVVSSTSLELGIDIGHIDLVCQIGSPKSVAKGLQRIGRAGHDYGKPSRGRLIVFDNDDLIECAVLCRAAHRKHVDRVSIPRESLDVLAQTIVGMSLEKRWEAEEAYELIRRSYCYHALTRERFESVLRYLSGKEDFRGIYSKIWYDQEENIFGMKRGSRLIFYLNQGTIPEESSYKVLSEKGAPIGDLSEKFVERLSKGDIFVLGGKSYEFIRTRGMRVFVKHALGRKPTVPSWTGEMLPRSFDLSVEVGRFRRELDARLNSHTDEENIDWLRREFDVDEGSAQSIITYFKEQRTALGIPTDDTLIIEGYRDEEGKSNIIFHFPFGRRVNDALSRAFAFRISNKYGFNTTVSVTDDCFMITLPKEIPLDEVPSLISSGNLESLLRSSLKDTELIAQRFRHCATRSFMILKNYRGKELSLSRQQSRSQRLLEVLRTVEDFPVVVETYNEILNEVFDLEHAREVLTTIEADERKITTIGYGDAPSPFSHNVLLAGISDVVLMEDRSSLLRQLHRKVLAKILGAEALAEYTFSEEKVEAHFSAKIGDVRNEKELLALLRRTGPLHLFKDKGLNASSLTGLPLERIRKMTKKLLEEGKIRSVWLSDAHWMTSEERDELSIALDRRAVQSKLSGKILTFIKSPKSLAKISSEFSLSREEAMEILRSLERDFLAERASFSSNSFRWKATSPAYGDREHARERIIERHLGAFAPLTLQEIAYHFRLSEEETKETISLLESRGRIVSGRFIIGEDIQYMLTNDYVSLSNEGKEVFDEENVRRYQLSKQFVGINSIDEYFERFSEAGMLCDIFQRYPSINLDEWILKRTSGQILVGRFLRSKVRYVRAEDAAYFVSLYREGDPSDFENAILRKIDELDGASIFDLERKMDEPRERIKAAIDRLDQDMFVVREYMDGEDWTGINVYHSFEPEKSTTESESAFWLIKNFLLGHGPVSLSAIKSYTALDIDIILSILDRLEVRKILISPSGIELYALEEDVERLRSFSSSPDRMRILSLYDPFLETRRIELLSRFGDGWFFPVIRDGVIIGMTDVWPLSSCIEVRDIALDEPSEEMLAEFLDALDQFASFFVSSGIDVVRIRSAFGMDVSELDKRFSSVLTNAGYRMINGMLVKGKVVDDLFDDTEIISYIFSKQHLNDAKRYANLTTALRIMGGLRSEVEGLIRSKRIKGDSRITKMKGVFRGIGIPSYLMFMNMSHAAIYRAARNAEIDDEMRLILQIISTNPPISKDRILELSPLGPIATSEAIRKLYQKTMIVFNSNRKYRMVEDADLTPFEARKAVVKQAFDMFNFFSAEGLAHYLRHSFSMRDLRKVLRQLEEEGYLSKGYLRVNDETLYWIIKPDLRRLRRLKFQDEFVLSSQDRLATYLRDVVKIRYGDADQYLIFDGTHCCGKFRARIDRHEIEIWEFEGDVRAREILRAFSSRIGRAIHQEDKKRLSEWEISDFFERTHLFARED